MPRQNARSSKKNSTKKTQGKGREKDDEPKPFYAEMDLDDYFGLKGEQEKKHIPGKHRFFQQNYVHPVYTKDEGYGIAYQFCGHASVFDKMRQLAEVKDIDQEFEPHVLEFLENGFLVHNHWDRFEKEMRKVSEKPLMENKLIAIKCIGEDFSGITNDEIDNLYIYYFKDGKSYSRDAEIVFPQFDHTQLI